jgi:Domain of unknown function (DUF4304)
MGFSVSGATFHRANDAQFVEVVNLQAGLRHLAGKSAVNLGIYIPEVKLLLGKSRTIEEARANVTPFETECMIRVRLSTLVFGKDIWYDHNDPIADRTVTALLLKHGLPWFRRLGTLQAMAAELKKVSRPLLVGWGYQAAILKAARDTAGARSFLSQLRDVDPVDVRVFASSIGIEMTEEAE